MPIDACASTFGEMAATVLPDDMAKLLTALAAPLSLSFFCEHGVGPKFHPFQIEKAKRFFGLLCARAGRQGVLRWHFTNCGSKASPARKGQDPQRCKSCIPNGNRENRS